MASCLVLAPGFSASSLAVLVPDGLRWSGCGDMPPPVECAELTVPLDHADPSSRTIRLPLRRLRASDPDERIGVLVTIAGGPGQRGTLWVRPGAHTDAISARFDIVSWDPRGTSGETLIDCVPEWDPYRGLDRTPDSAAERQVLDAAIARLAARCRDAHGELLAHVGTLESALDLERLRQALDEPQISLMGTSYGSRVALTYATLFPGRVRGVVLDGYSDPNATPGERELEQARVFERELERLLSACAADRDMPLPPRCIDRRRPRPPARTARCHAATGRRGQGPDAVGRPRGHRRGPRS